MAPDGVDHAHKNRCIEEATQSGAQGAALGLGLSAPSVYAAHRLSPMFKKFSVSTKTGLVVSPVFLFFFLHSELTMNACAQRRREFLAAEMAARK